jgi:hypothetical protein
MIADFLKTDRPKEDLKMALEVLREFKKCESTEEWAYTPFAVWSKLEQLEDFLEHLVEGTELEDDIIGEERKDDA